MVKNDKIDALIILSGNVLIQKNTEFYKSVDTSTTQCSKSLDRKVQRSINRENRKNEFGDFYKYAKRFAIVLLIVCTLSFSVVMAVEPIREAIWNVIVEFFDDYMEIVFVSQGQYPSVIEEIRDIDPGDVNLEKQIVLSSDSIYCVSYNDGEEIVLLYSQQIIDSPGAWIDNENSLLKNVKVGDNPAILIYRVHHQTYSLCWSDDEYSYSLDTHSPEISEEKLISIAQTIG